MSNTLEEIMKLVKEQVETNQKNWPNPYNSLHEAYGILTEEHAEFFDIVRLKQSKRNLDDTVKELIDIASVSIKTILDVCTEEGIRK